MNCEPSSEAGTLNHPLPARESFGLWALGLGVGFAAALLGDFILFGCAGLMSLIFLVSEPGVEPVTRYAASVILLTLYLGCTILVGRRLVHSVEATLIRLSAEKARSR